MISDSSLDLLLQKTTLEQKFLEKEPYKSPVEKDKIAGGVNSLIPVNPYASKILIRLDNKLITSEDILSFDPAIRATGGRYMVRYYGPGATRYKKGRPFQIGQDLIHWDIRVAGYAHWKALTHYIPELKWLDQNSTLTSFLFAVAKMHPGMSIFFTINRDKYVNEILEQGKNSGLTPGSDFTPLGVHRPSFKEYNEKYKNMPIPKCRYVNEILKEINEVERLPSVQKEMEEECGIVYTRGRNTLRDPVTGQFLKHDKIKEKENN